MIDLHTDEQSYVVVHSGKREDEHTPVRLPRIDVYHLEVAVGAEIEVTIIRQGGE